jgi:hypothetical protein
MFWLITIDFSQKSPHFSLLSPTSPCELSEREVTSPSNLKVVGALDNYSLVFVIFINFFGQLKDWVGQVLFLVSCPKGQVKKYVNVEACGVRAKGFFFLLRNIRKIDGTFKSVQAIHGIRPNRVRGTEVWLYIFTNGPSWLPTTWNVHSTTPTLVKKQK